MTKEEKIEEKIDYYEEDMEMLSKAMLEAKERFNQFLEEECGLEPAYFELRMKGVKLSANLEPFKTIRMMDYNNKKENKPMDGLK